MGNEKMPLFLLYIILCQLGFSSSLSYLCPKNQALALLEFKKMFIIDPFASKFGECASKKEKTLSWNTSTDCCLWDGIRCDETTSQVIELDLSCSQLKGKFSSNSSIFQLSTLERLDLSMNDFSQSQIPPNFGGFINLKHLDLSNSGFTGQIPSEISNLSKLRFLSIIDYSDGFTLEPYDFQQLLTNLTQLRELEFYSVSISSVIPQNFSSYLTTLRLPQTQLYGTLPEKVFHLSNLSFLDLSRNHQLIVRFPVTKWNCSASLKDLYLDEVNFTKIVPEPLSNFFGPIRLFNENWTKLESLHLSSNFLTGSIPSDVSGFQSLIYLLLSSNNLNGSIPSWISSLPSLKYLDLSNNYFNGQIEEFKSEKMFWIDLGSNHLQSPIPNSLLNQRRLLFLNLSSNNFSDNLKFSMFNSSILGTLDLSYNSFSWTNENDQAKSNLLRLYHLDLRFNLLQGSLPIPPRSIQYFFISQNKLRGHIPSAICNLEFLQVLDLASNSLTGAIPLCLGNMSSIEVLDLRHNNLSMTIQTNFSIESPLRSFNLHGNKLIGKIPRSLVNCKLLEVLDLGNNQLNDTFPMWLGTLPNLMVLNLRSNKLHGVIRPSRNKTLFPQLQIIDLSFNGFYGDLPSYLFESLQSMQKDNANMKTPRYIGDYYYKDSITISSKGMSIELVRILSIYTTIDLSSNRFEGYIPSVIGNLTSLVVLNLSHNILEGHIPASLGSVSALESLDLSFNKLGGEIPRQLASLTFLGFLRLSHNHLVGCIPSGSQFATFQNSSFEGNNGLRGFPLSKNCGDTQVPQQSTPSSLDDDEEDDNGFEISWEAALMGYGCGLIIGLSIIYIMSSTQKPIWLFRKIGEWEHRIVMRKKKKVTRHIRRKGL